MRLETYLPLLIYVLCLRWQSPSCSRSLSAYLRSQEARTSKVSSLTKAVFRPRPSMVAFQSSFYHDRHALRRL